MAHLIARRTFDWNRPLFGRMSRRRFAGIACLLGLGLPRPKGLLAAGNRSSKPVIEIQENDDWGDAPISNIRAVLESAAAAIWQHCPAVRLDPIRVYYRAAGPITLFRRAPDGRIQVGLSSRDTYWAQFAFQFGHEFAHVLAVHGNNWKAKWRKVEHANHWLEEALSETASLFVLRAMSRSWAKRPPYPNWKSFAPKLAEYAAKRMSESRFQIPPGQTFAQWFAQALPQLRQTPGPSNNSVIVAKEFLALFEQEPAGWEALAWLNLGRRDVNESLADYLEEWARLCPKRRQPLVQRLARRLESA